MTTVPPPVRSSRRWLPPALDLVCLATFVLVGAGQHDVDEGLGWFLTVLWPLVVAWFGIAALVHLYTFDERSWVKLAITLVAGALVNAVLRWAFTDRPFLSAYTPVFMAWMVLTAYGWRGAAALLRTLRRERLQGTALSG